MFYKLWDDDSGEYDRFTEASIDTANCAIDENDNIYEKISKATTWMHQVTSALIVTRNDDDEGGDSDLNGNCELYENSIAYGYCNPGVEAALKSIKASMSELEETYSGVVDSLQKLGYDFDASGYIGDNITELLNFLASELNEDFSLDPIISELMRCKNQIVVLRTQFTDLEHEYQTLGDFKGYNQELTDENIEIFRQVTRNVDSDNQKSLLEDINSAISEYYSI